MAGRTKFSAYLMFAGLMTAFIYPVVVHWTWGGGLIAEYINWETQEATLTLLDQESFTSPVVSQHIWAPKLSDLESANTTKTANHEPYLATTSCSPSSVSSSSGSDGSDLTPVQNSQQTDTSCQSPSTPIAAAAGGAVSAIVVVAKTGKPDVGMVGNGVLGGLVGITAGCGAFNTFGSLITGAVAGALVVYSVLYIGRRASMIQSVQYPYGTCGIWGVLAIGLFSRYDDAFLGRDDAGLFYGGDLIN